MARTRGFNDGRFLLCPKYAPNNKGAADGGIAKEDLGFSRAAPGL